MKTIFITSFHPLISRNILSTKLVKLLTADPVVQVVILCHEKKKWFFEKHFSGERVAIEGVPYRLGWQDRLFHYLSTALVRTHSLDLKRKTEMEGRGQLPAFIFGKVKAVRPLFRFMSALLTPAGDLVPLFERYRPTVVFGTDIQNQFDLRMLYGAKRRRIPTVAMVRSWDNLGSKGLLRYIPDRLVVHNRILVREAGEIDQVPADRIDVVGIPHYDVYGTPVSSRESFAARVGLDPQRPIVLFVPTGDRYLKKNTVDRDIVKMLDATLPPRYQILVRVPPTDRVALLEKERGILPERVHLDRPESEFETLKNVELTEDDDERLRDSLYFSDLVVAGPSTVCIDAAVYDKPVVLTAFDGYESRPYLESLARYFEYDHWVSVRESGGAVFAKTKEEFTNAVKGYLENPSLDRGGRERIVRDECFAKDGKSTERLHRVISVAITSSGENL